MKKKLLFASLIASFFTSAQINVNEGFENTTYPGFTNMSFFRSSVISACVGSYTINREFWSGGTTGSTTFGSSASNGGKLNISFQYKTHIYSGGSVNGTMKIEYSVDGGQNYQALQTINLNAVQSCTTWSGSIPQGDIPINADFKFRVSGQWVSGDYWLLIDDFKISQDAVLATVDFSRKESKIYPNPFKDVIYLDNPELIRSVSISDVSGRRLKTMKITSREIKLSELDKGNYILTIDYKDGGRNSSKVIKQ
ncbi:T9SS type A sorting domain-containing protein [Epilithonimonas sp.]|uniref:T9SS type A sorting domain-containing protein n=1 Tax=Epilithonimonas sp. TaxID=2894511 RepID=UPI00289C460E|nr:T9SS type A sorting domain-containing protein [Epilithonimonas sp.]